MHVHKSCQRSQTVREKISIARKIDYTNTKHPGNCGVSAEGDTMRALAGNRKSLRQFQDEIRGPVADWFIRAIGIAADSLSVPFAFFTRSSVFRLNTISTSLVNRRQNNWLWTKRFPAVGARTVLTNFRPPTNRTSEICVEPLSSAIRLRDMNEKEKKKASWYLFKRIGTILLSETNCDKITYVLRKHAMKHLKDTNLYN